MLEISHLAIKKIVLLFLSVAPIEIVITQNVKGRMLRKQ